MQPHTFMNLSGASVQPARDFYSLKNEEILVVCDDFHLPAGKLRFRPGGSAGGQKGLANILKRLGGQDVPRLRIGIGQLTRALGRCRFCAESVLESRGCAEIQDAVERASAAVADWIEQGTAYCMNRYNGDPLSTRCEKTRS